MNLMNLLSFLLIYFNLLSDKSASPSQPRIEFGRLANCHFCNATSENGFHILFENETFLAFHDKNPSSLHHVQVIPKEHFGNIQSLCKDDIPLVKSMEEIGHRILDTLEIPYSNRKLGFHVPPFISVEHLHLHVLGLPYRSFARRRKYPVTSGGKGYSKGFSWFVDVRQAIEILERDRRVEVWSC